MQFKKSFLHRASPVATSGHLYYLLFLTFSIFSFRSSQRKCSMKKLFLKLGIFTGKHLCWSLFLIKFRVEGLKLYEKETPTQVFLNILISCDYVPVHH